MGLLDDSLIIGITTKEHPRRLEAKANSIIKRTKTRRGKRKKNKYSRYSWI